MAIPKDPKGKANQTTLKAILSEMDRGRKQSKGIPGLLGGDPYNSGLLPNASPRPGPAQASYVDDLSNKLAAYATPSPSNSSGGGAFDTPAPGGDRSVNFPYQQATGNYQDHQAQAQDPLQAILQQAQSQASAQIDPQLQALQAAIDAAHKQIAQGKSSASQAYGALAAEAPKNAAAVDARYADANARTAQNYGDLANTINGSFDKGQADVRATLERLGISAGADESLQRSESQQALLAGLAGTNRQNALDAQGLVGGAAHDSALFHGDIARQQGINTGVQFDRLGAQQDMQFGQQRATLEGQRQSLMQSIQKQLMDQQQAQLKAQDQASQDALKLANTHYSGSGGAENYLIQQANYTPEHAQEAINLLRQFAGTHVGNAGTPQAPNEQIISPKVTDNNGNIIDNPLYGKHLTRTNDPYQLQEQLNYFLNMTGHNNNPQDKQNLINAFNAMMGKY